MKKNISIKKVKELATKVYATLGAGYNETVYEEALAIEMRKAKMKYDIELNLEIMYEGEKVGTHTLDFIIDRKLVIELKATGSLTKSHRVQLKSYLKTLGLGTGLLINFAYPEKEEPDIEEISI